MTRILLILLFPLLLFAPPPPDEDWRANGGIRAAEIVTDSGVGDAQGGVTHHGKIYIYGDLTEATPRRGIIREYDLDLKPTGRDIHLMKDGAVVSIHPTGLTFHPRWGTLLSDTWQRKGTLFQIDWEKALQDGNLNRAILRTIQDDAAGNGARGIFATVGGKTFVVTGDYGDQNPKLRFYDPEKLSRAKHTSEPGVLVHSLAIGPYTQNLHWDEKSKEITLIQNVIAGLGWKLDHLDIERAFLAKSADEPGVRKGGNSYLPHDELEGWLRLPSGRELFITSSQVNNLTFGYSEPMAERLSPKGEMRVHLHENPLKVRDISSCSSILQKTS